ncbi:MAG: hypothetical protein E7514_04955 [Ruminococcaceae bacterium]|nr:hypothetical protein [Oscillospiraceae bacterium]
MKKTLSILLSFIMLLSIISGLSFSAYADTFSGYNYTVINGNEAEITGYFGSSPTTLEIPTNCNGNTVTSIGEGAFSDRDDIQVVTIPATVTKIEDYAFDHCTGLKSVYINGTSVTIGEGAFYGCTSLVGYGGTGSIASLGLNCFTDCTSLKTITISAATTSIGNAVFAGCTALESISVESGNKYYYATDGVLFFKSGDTSLIAYPEGNTATSFTIPDGVKNIRYGAFSNNKYLKSITIPATVTNIDDGAFNKCTALKDVYYNDTEAKWALVSVGTEENAGLINATMHFKSEPDPDPIVFPDVAEGAWYYEAVQYCAQHKFINGYQDGRFGPNDALQRQDFVVILANIAGADLSGYTSCKLSDVQMSAYYGKAVAWAVDKGIIAGYQNGKFGVGDPITREQVATILYRYMKSPAVSDVDSKLAKFPDKGNISEFAKAPLAWAVENNIISGMQDGTVAPKSTAVRAQIASIIMRMDQNGMFNA